MSLIYFTKRAAFVSLALVVFSCNKNSNEIDLPAQEKGHFKISFVNNDGFQLNAPTKAEVYDFFGATEAMAQENILNNVTLFAYPSGSAAPADDVPVLKHTFTAAEIKAKKAIFSLPSTEDPTGKLYDFYVVANHDDLTRGALLAIELKESDLTTYNKTTSGKSLFNGTTGVFTDVSTPTLGARNEGGKDNGFTMAGVTMAVAANLNAQAPRDVEVKLNRVVNKIAVRARYTELFKNKYITPYNATLVIKEIRLHSLRASSNLILPAAATTTLANAIVINHTQEPSISVIANATTGEGEFWDAMVYSFENGSTVAPSADKPQIEIIAEYDFDGDGLDNSPVTITYKATAVTGDGDGLLKRNGFYKINVKINGLTPQEIIATFVVENWSVPATQEIEIGG